MEYFCQEIAAGTKRPLRKIQRKFNEMHGTGRVYIGAACRIGGQVGHYKLRTVRPGSAQKFSEYLIGAEAP